MRQTIKRILREETESPLFVRRRFTLEDLERLVNEVKEMIDMQNRVNFDIWYIENWTYWLDLQIIFQTIINLIKGDEKAF